MRALQITELADVPDSDAVGGKARALSHMLQAGFQVPAGFVITVPGGVTVADDSTKILDAYDLLDARWVAVRSSALQEDGQNASWAGQLSTFLYVDRENLLDRIHDCLVAAQAASQGAYAQHFKSDDSATAVIVQVMVDSDVSGVAFSAHPVSGDRNQIVIEAGLGLGEAVVSGEITPDTYVIDAKTGAITSAQIATQNKKLQLGPAGGTSWEAITPAATGQKLTSNQLTELTGLVQKLATHYNYPVDIEWAWAHEQLYVLQCRPLTALP